MTFLSEIRALGAVAYPSGMTLWINDLSLIFSHQVDHLCDCISLIKRIWTECIVIPEWARY